MTNVINDVEVFHNPECEWTVRCCSTGRIICEGLDTKEAAEEERDAYLQELHSYNMRERFSCRTQENQHE